MPRPNMPADSIAEALFGSTRRNVLALLFGNPDSEFYLRQIVRQTGTGVGAVQRELATLADAGLIVRSPDGNQVYFRANRESPVFEELRSLVAKTMGVADVLRTALLELDIGKAIRYAFIFGSVATGSQITSSDVDLMIVGPMKLSDLVPALRSAGRSLDREVNVSVFTFDDVHAKAEANQHFITRVLEQPKIMLIGDEDDLARLGGESLAP